MHVTCRETVITGSPTKSRRELAIEHDRKFVPVDVSQIRRPLHCTYIVTWQQRDLNTKKISLLSTGEAVSPTRRDKLNRRVKRVWIVLVRRDYRGC